MGRLRRRPSPGATLPGATAASSARRPPRHGDGETRPDRHLPDLWGWEPSRPVFRLPRRAWEYYCNRTNSVRYFIMPVRLTNISRTNTPAHNIWTTFDRGSFSKWIFQSLLTSLIDILRKIILTVKIEAQDPFVTSPFVCKGTMTFDINCINDSLFLVN